MKVKFYVDWEGENVMTPAEFQKVLADEAAERYKDDDHLGEFLVDDKSMSISDVFRLNESEKAQLMEEFKAYCHEVAFRALVDYGSISEEELDF